MIHHREAQGHHIDMLLIQPLKDVQTCVPLGNKMFSRHSVYVLLLVLVLASGCKQQGATQAQEAHRFELGHTLAFNDQGARTYFSGWSGSWDVHQGVLRSLGDQNAPLWFNTELPDNAEITFDATPASTQVDMKVELYGDGLRHQSGYIVILGGWKNTRSVIARLDEHERDRVSYTKKKWRRGETLHVRIRRDGETLTAFVNDERILTYDDPKPLRGPRHRFMAFNSWKSEVSYDNLKVTPL